jgi:hypothetical protein
MLFTAAQIIKNAFYLANIKSQAAQDTLSSNETEIGLNILNEILDSLTNNPSFSSYENISKIENITTPEIWIGSSINNAASNVTVVNAIPYMVIYSAQCFVSNDATQKPLNYPLIIMPYATLSVHYYVNREGIPQYLYYTTISDIDPAQTTNDNGVYNKILLDPAPGDQGITLNLIGIKQYPEVSDSTNVIMPTFSLFLQYAVAFELAMLYGKEAEWINTVKSQRKNELFERLLNNNPMDVTIEPMNKAYTDTDGFYTFTNSSN